MSAVAQTEATLGDQLRSFLENRSKDDTTHIQAGQLRTSFSNWLMDAAKDLPKALATIFNGSRESAHMFQMPEPGVAARTLHEETTYRFSPSSTIQKLSLLNDIDVTATEGYIYLDETCKKLGVSFSLSAKKIHHANTVTVTVDARYPYVKNKPLPTWARAIM